MYLARVFLSLSLMVAVQFVLAQDPTKCSAAIPSAAWENELSRMVDIFKSAQVLSQKQASVVTIPVIFHVIHGGEPVGTYPNIAQGQINSQMQVLNDDFAGIGKNYGIYPSQAYCAWAALNNIAAGSLDAWSRVKIADCSVQFCLAKYDTLGNLLAEPGIERINYLSRGWANTATITTLNALTNHIQTVLKPATIWNVSKYLNVWLSDKSNLVSVIGFGSFPTLSTLSGVFGGGTSTNDGIWCYSKVVGSAQYFPNGAYSGSYTLGRTMTHEAGHYFGLHHIWGNSACGQDYCNDTPPASTANNGSPNYPSKVGSCPNNSPEGEMFMNFMDYTADAAQYMFTEDQAIRIQTASTNSPYRKFLGTHGLCSVEPIASVAAFSISGALCGPSAVITPTNASNGTPPPTYTWTVNGGGLISPNANSSFVNITLPNPGTYSISLTTDNGTVSSVTKVIQIKSPPIVSIIGASSVACLGSAVSLTATGASWYVWMPPSVISNTHSFVANANQSFTVSGVDQFSCKSNTVLTINTAICTSFEPSHGFPSWAVYPSPTNGQVTIENSNLAARTIQIFDASGRLMFATTSHEFKLVVDMSTWKPGIYLVSMVADGFYSTQKLIKE